MKSTVLNSEAKSTKELIQAGLTRALSYNAYRDLVARLAAEGKSTGPEQTEALANYTILNDRRMKRFDKTVKIAPETEHKIKELTKSFTMLVLTESWCGDAAPSMPVMNKIAEINPNIAFKVLLRDENLELMSRFLTNGALSIPKLIVIDNETEEVVSEWGPRPEPAAELVRIHKALHGKLLPEIKEEIQQWYNKDKGQTTLKELLSSLTLK